MNPRLNERKPARITARGDAGRGGGVGASHGPAAVGGIWVETALGRATMVLTRRDEKRGVRLLEGSEGEGLAG